MDLEAPTERVSPSYLDGDDGSGEVLQVLRLADSDTPPEKHVH